MIYRILRPITRLVLQGYYRKLYVNGQENIPSGQPVILAVNHPSAFTEPCVLATHLNRELYFLIRGDVVNDRMKWFFEGTNQVPIYRFRDGFSGMRQNEKQFSFCFDVLKNNGCITIFAEGSTRHIKQTRPIQKGAARIAFGALQNREMEEVWVVPVGVNFESSPRARSTVAVEIGHPISTREWYSLYLENERDGLQALTNEIYKGLKPMMIHIEDDRRFSLANDILDYKSHEINKKIWPVAEYNNRDYFERMDRTAKKINQIEEDEWGVLKQTKKVYEQKLNEHSLSDAAVSGSSTSLMALLVMFPFALAGWLFLYPVKWLSFLLQKRLNRKAEYVSGFRMAGLLVFIPVFIMIWMIIASFWWGWWVLTFIVVLPVFSQVAVLWIDQWHQWRQKIKWRSVSSADQHNILQLRHQIMGRFENADV